MKFSVQYKKCSNIEYSSTISESGDNYGLVYSETKLSLTQDNL